MVSSNQSIGLYLPLRHVISRIYRNDFLINFFIVSIDWFLKFQVEMTDPMDSLSNEEFEIIERGDGELTDLSISIFQHSHQIYSPKTVNFQ